MTRPFFWHPYQVSINKLSPLFSLLQASAHQPHLPTHLPPHLYSLVYFSPSPQPQPPSIPMAPIPIALIEPDNEFEAVSIHDLINCRCAQAPLPPSPSNP